MQDSLDEVSVNLIEGGFIGKLKARENTTYEIDVINHPDVDLGENARHKIEL